MSNSETGILANDLIKAAQDHAEVEKKLGLPNRHYYSPWDSSTTYGVNRILNRYCKLNFPGEWPLAGWWNHGWLPSFTMFHPQLVSQQAQPGEYSLNLTPRQDMARILEQNGFSTVRAVGMPLVYLENLNVRRLLDSVLVAPFHSPPGYKITTAGGGDFADVLKELKRKFELVVGCVHPRCLQNGMWINEFNEAGIPYVTGANMRDVNSLYRMQFLFSRFEHVATNGFGSLLAYAAFFGAKIWLAGDYCPLREEHLKKDIFYATHPEVMAAAIEMFSEPVLRRACPFLWDSPTQATPKIEWAHSELGADCRLTPDEAKRVFGLQPGTRIKNAVARLPKRLTWAVRRRLFARRAG